MIAILVMLSFSVYAKHNVVFHSIQELKGNIEGARIGGLSACSFDSRANKLYFLSDDRSLVAPSRIIVFDGINIKDKMTFDSTRNIYLTNKKATFSKYELDPEGFILRDNIFSVTSEGDFDLFRQKRMPMLLKFSLQGNLIKSYPFDSKYNFSRHLGPYNNEVFESLTTDGTHLFYSTEGPLKQDNMPYTYVRITKENIEKGTRHEYAYPIRHRKNIATRNGLVELLYLNHGKFLSLERSFNKAFLKTSVSMFEIDIHGATNVFSLPSLKNQVFQPVRKTKILDFEELFRESKIDYRMDNFEGLCRGPKIKGKQFFFMISDDNFFKVQKTLLLTFSFSSSVD